MKNLLIAIVAISFSFAITSCSAPKGLKYVGVQDLSVQKDKDNPFLVYIKLYNPNKFPLEIKYGNIETFLEDLPLGEIKYDTVIKVAGNGTLLLPLSYNPDYKSMFPNPKRHLTQPTLNVKVNGSLSVERKGKFYNTAIHYQGDMTQAQ